VTLAFRRWRRPTVKTGGRLRTSIGELRIEAVELVDESRITDEEIASSGIGDRATLERYLGDGRDGDVYRITLSYGGPDARIALRERGELSDDEYATIRRRLARMDAAAANGPWTERYLRLIEARPDVLALDLATSIGVERDPFKINVTRHAAVTSGTSHGARASRRAPRSAAPVSRASSRSGSSREPSSGSRR
jgi:hypothetical protein